MKLSDKVASIKEKIRQLASKLDQLRTENRILMEENRDLRIKVQRDAEEMNFIRHQLAALKEKIITRTPETVIEKEERG